MFSLEINRLDSVSNLADIVAIATCSRDMTPGVVLSEWRNSLDGHAVSDSTFAAMESYVQGAADYHAATIAATLADPFTDETAPDEFPVLFILYGLQGFLALEGEGA
jgi:hypothetical protein